MPPRAGNAHLKRPHGVGVFQMYPSDVPCIAGQGLEQPPGPRHPRLIEKGGLLPHYLEAVEGERPRPA